MPLNRRHPVRRRAPSRFARREGAHRARRRGLRTHAHRSTRALTDKNGLVVRTFDYDAYGNAISFDASAALTSLLYSGEEFNVNTGFSHLRARYYDPRNGRFTRMDPFAGDIQNPLSLHKYGYVHGNPILNIDPSGRITLVQSLVTIGISTTLTGTLGFAATGTVKGTFYGAYAGAATSGAVVLILANPFNKGSTALGSDLAALGVSTYLGALLGALNYYINIANRAPTFQEILSQFRPSGFATAVFAGIAHANTGFVASYGLMSVLPGFSAKAKSLVSHLGEEEQAAAGAFIGQASRAFASGQIFSEPVATLSRIIGYTAVTYLVAKKFDSSEVDAIAGYLTSNLIRLIDRDIVEFVRLMRT